MTWGLCDLWGVRRETEIEKQKAQASGCPSWYYQTAHCTQTPPLHGYSCGPVAREAATPRAEQTRPCLRPWASSLSLCFLLLLASSSRVTCIGICYYIDCRTRGASFPESNVTGTTDAVAPGIVLWVCARHERTSIMDAAPSDSTSKAQRIEVTSPPGSRETG